MKIAYIAHPISGSIPGNMLKILSIVKDINLTEPETVPFAPYLSDCQALDDDIPEQRARGIKNDIELFNRGFIDEVRLYGDKISRGMLEEVKLAWKLEIPVVPCTKETQRDYQLLLDLVTPVN